MDYTIIYIILIVSSIIGLTFLSKYLRERNIVKTEDLIFAMQVLKLSVDIVDQLNLKHETKIKNLAEIILDSVAYAVENMQNQEDIKNLATARAYEMCSNFNIELTDERKQIIQQLIEILLSNNIK